MCEFCGCGMKSTVKHTFRRPGATEKPLAIRTVALPAEPKTSAAEYGGRSVSMDSGDSRVDRVVQNTRIQE